MKQIVYSDYNDLDLPLYVKKYLGNHNALANIRDLDDESYIIMSYPFDENSVQPICIKQSQNELTIYTHESIEIENLETLNFTDLVFTTLEHYESLIQKIHLESEAFQETMGNGITKMQVDQLILMKRHLILYQQAVTAIKEVVDYIQDHKPKQLWSQPSQCDTVNILIEMKQIDQNISMLSEIIDVILDVSNALYSNKLNIVMKRLAVITLVISIPTLVTSFYGMNVDLPFQNHSYALILIFIISLGLTSFALYIMQKRDYL
ncbi:CorA family divalent cation transporter [Erysipelothrix larvae]|nr:CorA family divalent cation transporter [Erysipelothrix larvae]